MFPKNLFNSPDDLVKAVTEIMTGKSKKEALDPVDAKALKGSHADRKDKDIDNDGDVDSSDEYLHNRRKAVMKAMKEATKVKENDDNDDDDMEDDDDEMTDAQKNDMDGDGKNDKKKKKNKDDELSDKPDKIDTKPSMDDARTMMAKEEVDLDEGKSGTGYDLYHKDFSSAMKHAYDFAKRKYGITISNDEIDDKVATGPRKPSEGKTNSYRLKGDKGAIQVQVYNKGGSKPFELNMYKEEVDLDEMSDVQMKKREEIVKGMKKSSGDLKKRYGDRWKDVMYATATKQAMKEEMVDEARGRPKKEDDVSTDSNFVMQMRKAISLNGNKVNFLDGTSSQVSSRDAQQFMIVYNKQKSSIDKGRLMNSAHKSLKHFKMALQGKIEKPKNPLDLD